MESFGPGARRLIFPHLSYRFLSPPDWKTFAVISGWPFPPPSFEARIPPHSVERRNLFCPDRRLLSPARPKSDRKMITPPFFHYVLPGHPFLGLKDGRRNRSILTLKPPMPTFRRHRASAPSIAARCRAALCFSFPFFFPSGCKRDANSRPHLETFSPPFVFIDQREPGMISKPSHPTVSFHGNTPDVPFAGMTQFPRVQVSLPGT